jgi:hypothetical protein
MLICKLESETNVEKEAECKRSEDGMGERE